MAHGASGEEKRWGSGVDRVDQDVGVDDDALPLLGVVAFARVRACHDAERRSVEADRISSSMQWAELCVPRSWAGKAREGKGRCVR